MAQYRPEEASLTPHICENCGATVGDEQFCPTCGEWIDPLKGGNAQDFEQFTLEEGPPPGEPPIGSDADTGEEPAQIRRQPARYEEEIPCPSCGTRNPMTNRHCENCGARLTQGALPVAPRPAVQTTAGVRAALGIAGILLLVILAVTLVNLIGGDDPEAAADTSSTSTSTTRPPDPVPLPILDVDCAIDGIPGFPCDNLIDDLEGEYQFNWDQLDEGAEVAIVFTFPQAVEISGLIWENIPADENDRFLQNYKVQRITVEDDRGPEIPLGIANQAGTIPLNYISPRTNKLTVRIVAVHPAEDVDGQQFSDLAVRGIQILGNPVATDAGTQAGTTEPGADTTDTTASG